MNYLKDTRKKLEIELEQYRSLGTVEELRELVAKGKSYGQVAWERDIAISQLEEIGCSLGEKMDEVKDLREKQRAKKPIVIKPYKGAIYYLVRYLCPSCNELLSINHRCCPQCGQAIDWSECK